MFLARYLLRLSMAVNQCINATFGGDPDMSLSARAGYARQHGSKGGVVACRILEFLDPHIANDKRPPETKIAGDHCQIAIINHEEGND